jgi:AraC family transcriptional regulator
MKRLTLSAYRNLLSRRMKHVARGRIVLWEGGSLWAFDVPPSTALRQGTDVHAHHAIQLNFSVGGSFSFHIEDQVVEGPIVLIAPEVLHAYYPQGRNAMIFIEPESRTGAAVLRDLAGRKAIRLDMTKFMDIVARLSCIWEVPRPDDTSLAGLGQELAIRLVGDTVAVQTLDPRIKRVLERLAMELDTRLSVVQAAGIACLSESRFSHLFVTEVGLPFRTYLLWRRMMVSVNRIAAGETLTSAAHEAGFADSAHFSRTFLRMFGVPASLLLMI